MKIDTNQIVTVSEANQNFSRVTRIVDKSGKAVIFKNSKPQYVVLSLTDGEPLELTVDEKIDIVASRILKKYLPAFEELAK